MTMERFFADAEEWLQGADGERRRRLKSGCRSRGHDGQPGSAAPLDFTDWLARTKDIVQNTSRQLRFPTSLPTGCKLDKVRHAPKSCSPMTA